MPPTLAVAGLSTRRSSQPSPPPVPSPALRCQRALAARLVCTSSITDLAFRRPSACPCRLAKPVTASMMPRARPLCPQLVRGMKIYTKTGDKGKSSLFTGKRALKTSDYFQALGHVDELNSVVGIAREHCLTLKGCEATRDRVVLLLDDIQSRLMDVGAAVATPLSQADDAQKARTKFDGSNVTVLEQAIDELDAQLPALTQFILPSGGLPSAHLHQARAVCRRAERNVVPLVEQEDLDRVVQQYLNRLSDFLFVAARTAAKQHGAPEVIWQKAAAPPTEPSA